MKVVKTPADLSVPRPLGYYVTLGNFDGFHLGHQAVVAELVRASGAGGGAAVAITFDPHPAEIVGTDRAPRLLTPGRERLDVMTGAGLAELLVVPFTRHTAGRDAREFLVSVGVGAGSHLVLGYDFHMGRGRSTDLERLSMLGREMGFGLDVVPPVLFEGRPISSTRIREELEGGNAAAARAMLGRPYAVSGRVVRGEGVGRGLGYATANLEVGPRKLLPSDGVYLGSAAREAPGPGRVDRPALVYVGRRPSMGGGPRGVEVHILGEEAELYGNVLHVEIMRFLRADRAFSSKEELAAQIAEDVAQARGEAPAS